MTRAQSSNKQTESQISLEHEQQLLDHAILNINHMIDDLSQSVETIETEAMQLEAQIVQSEQSATHLRNKMLDQEKVLAEQDLFFLPEYQARFANYANIVKLPMSSEAKDIASLLRDREYLGVVVYPHAVHWEPLQRPQHLLIEFARKGYLCFFCDSDDEYTIREAEPNLFVLTNSNHLLQALQTTHVLLINSFLLQNAWFEHLPHRTVWYDVLDRVDFFGYYDRNMLAKHYEVLGSAEIVTYSARKLLNYVDRREDVIYLPNAVRPEDFNLTGSKKAFIPDDMKSILKPNKKIIGYYGAIEEWFDKRLVKSLAAQPNIEIVLIGYCGISRDGFPNNVHFLGPKPYLQLKLYAEHFDALIIPFKINELTNSVSPVKFFEYCALGKPIITTPMAEVLPFKGPGITFVRSGDSLKLNSSFWSLGSEGRKHLSTIARDNQWKGRLDLIEKEIQERPECLPVFANRSYEQHVSAFAATFLDFEGDNYYSGGAERYLVDLHEVCAELGLKLDIYQYGHFSWKRKYKQIDVYSLGHQTLNIHEFSLRNLNDFNLRYVQAVEQKAQLNFYSAFFQAFPQVAHPSIGISHGVAWDNHGCEYKEPHSFWNSIDRFIQSAQQVQLMVSVDTNTPNWFQTIAYSIGQKMKTIPNYVDPAVFYPVPKNEDDKVRIMFPRRLYEARGLYLTLAIIDKILSEYPQVEFHFVGKGFPEDVEKVEEAIKRWPNRIYCYHRDPDDMHEVYKQADIVLIPTLYSEGTSLSCLEACATGNAIIATRIGGLTDIIIDQFNGLLITPDSQSLEKAIIACLDDTELRLRLGNNALEVSRAFNKMNWKERWKVEIRNVMQMNGVTVNNNRESMEKKDIEIRIGSNAKKEIWLAEAVNQLKQGNTVYIRGCKEIEVEQSYGRIQWIHEDTKLYFQPEVMLFED